VIQWSLGRDGNSVAMERKRIVHTLDTPYSAVEWSESLLILPSSNMRTRMLTNKGRPQISQDDQDAILELLCQ